MTFFIWRLSKKRIPIGEILVKLRVCEDMPCKSCDENVQETMEHLFVKCPLTKKLW